MAQHTPGPWHATPFRRHSGRCDIGADDGANVAEVFSDPDGGPPRKVAEANARLIAAAPELLDACRAFTEAAHAVRDELNRRGIPCPASIALAAENARAAIAAAEGSRRARA